VHIERGVVAEISLDAVANNVRVAKSHLKPGTKLCAVVKANAYGHGAVRVAQEAARNGADFMAVALVQEAVELRDAGIDTPILVLGAMTPEVADITVKYDISHAVFDEERLYALNEAALKQNKKAKVHLKIDTGMHRIGIQVEDAGKFAKLAAGMPGIYIEGAFSHFATADADSKEYAAFQYARFMKAMELIEAEGIEIPIKHISNSAALTEIEAYQLDMVRQGITLYGLHPADITAGYERFEPVMRLKAKVSYVKALPAGETIGYGRTFTVNRPSIIATVPLGYADGISRKLSNKGYMLIKGKKAPIVGKVCMDQIMLDVTDIPNVKVGDEVIVFGGRELPMELVAEWAETICYEMVCAVSARVPREYVREK